MDLSQHQQPNAATRAYVEWVHGIAQDAAQVGLPCCCCWVRFALPEPVPPS